MSYKDREVRLQYARDHYIKNKAYYKTKSAIANKNRKIDNRKYINDLLNVSSCIDCGNSDRRVLDFDHVRGKKICAISLMKHQSVSLMKLKKEVKKCEIRCANCHRIATWDRRLANTKSTA